MVPLTGGWFRSFVCVACEEEMSGPALVIDGDRPVCFACLDDVYRQVLNDGRRQGFLTRGDG